MEGIQRSHAVQEGEVGEFALEGYEVLKANMDQKTYIKMASNSQPSIQPDNGQSLNQSQSSE